MFGLWGLTCNAFEKMGVSGGDGVLRWREYLVWGRDERFCLPAV